MQLFIKIITVMIAVTLISAAPASEKTSCITYEDICINTEIQVALVAAPKTIRKDRRILELRLTVSGSNCTLYARAVSMLMALLNQLMVVECTSDCLADPHPPR
jgi:hypothetical protein